MIGFPVRVYEGKNTLAGIFACIRDRPSGDAQSGQAHFVPFKNKGRKAINNGTSAL